MRAITAVPLLTLAGLALIVSPVGAQAPRDRGPAPQAVPRGEWDRYGRDRDDDRYERYPRSYRLDLAFGTGLNDGYEAGFEDGRRRHRFEPTREGRYRSANRGYDRRYGPRELWQARYRDGFRRGYDDGYNDGRRYYYRTHGRPGWWPF
jgi:hypothetical protein